MNRILLFVTIFSFGYMFNDVLKEFDLKLINEVSADVAGMDYKELRRDKDFRRAVKYVVAQDMKNISVNSMKRTVEDIVERNCKVDGKKIRC